MHFLVRLFLILLIWLLGIEYICGQRESTNQIPPQNPIGSSAIRDTTPSEVLPLDTPVAMAFVFIEDPEIIHSLKDSFYWNDNGHHPLPFEFAHLGNLGSASRTFVPDAGYRYRFFSGWDQFDPYYLDIASFRFYVQDVPVARIKHSQAKQDDTYLTLDFGRSFAKGMSLSLTYNKINQIGEFMHQHQNNTAFGVGVWHNAPSGTYDGFYNFISNNAIGEDNGGLSGSFSNEDPINISNTLPVFTSGGMTSHKHRFFATKQILHLLRDSIGLGIDLWLQGHLSTGLYKFVDLTAASSPEASDYYGARFLVDDRGLRQFTYQKEYQVESGISLPWKAARSTIQSSIQFRTIDLQQEPEKQRINELFWNVSGRFQWVDPILLKGQLSLGLGQAQGSFSFKSEALLNTGLLGVLKGHWSVLQRKPYLVESRLFVNQQLIYDFDFQNPFVNEIGVVWDWEKQNLRAGIQWFIFDNYIFFDTSRLPAQIEGSFSLRRFHVEKGFDFNWIGAKGSLVWQPDVRSELSIPDLIYEVSMYGRMKIFRKRLAVMPGVDFRFHDSFRNTSYFPLTGRYHLKEGDPIPDYFRVDAALGIHINFLKAFIRMEDIAGIWMDRVLYQADFYPHYPGYLRVGVEAGFFN